MLHNKEKTKEELQQEVQRLQRQVEQLQASQASLQQLVDLLVVKYDNLYNLLQNLPIGVQIFDVDGMCIDVNEAQTKIFGTTRDIIVGEFNIFKHSLSAQVGTQQAARQALETGQIVHLSDVHFDFTQNISRFNRSDGQQDLAVTFIPLRNDSGEIVQLVAFNEDITERKQAEQELRASEELFRQVVSSISDHIYVSEVTENGTRINIYLSPHVEAMTGYPHQKFIKDWTFWPRHVIHPEDRVAASRQAERLAQGQNSEVEYRLIRADGAVIWIRDRARVKQEGTSKFIYALVSDITEHKRIELEREWLTNELRDINQTLDERVRTRTAELQAILDSAGEGVVVTDVNGKIRYINPALSRLSGYTEEDALGKTPHLWNSGKHDKNFFRQMWQTIASGQTWRGEIINKRKDGSLFDVMLTIAPILGPDGRPTGYVGMQNDITPLKEMDRLKSEFISTAAHELRTPLTSIQGFSEILLTRDNLSQERKVRYLTFINQQAQALAAIIADMLDLSRLEAKQSFEITEQLVNLKTIVEPVVFGFQENHPDHSYEIEDAPVWPMIKGDEAKLSQLFRNLFSNATKYSPNGGKIRFAINVQSEHNILHMTVQDEGVGMTTEQLAQVFDRFYRADASNTAIGGTGLGMTISRLIVERHGGRIWVESEYGVGTTVHVLLPLPSRPAYILVVEDDDVLREVQQRSLQMQGYHVITAANGETGIFLAKTAMPDLVLLDLALPGMTGYSVMEKLATCDLGRPIAIIITSAMDRPEDIERAIQQGAADYLVKPYSMNDLLVRVNRAILDSQTENAKI